MSKKYGINEIFYSLQGEGVRAGTCNVFVRFSGCNLTCNVNDPFSGFDCDTEFSSNVKMSAKEIFDKAKELGGNCKNVIFTGGEPALQLDLDVLGYFKAHNWHTAIETNGTRNIAELGLDWITLSPKSAEHTLQQKGATEIKYVRRIGQGIPKPSINAVYKLISPAFNADSTINKEDLEYCINLIKENPEWRLSLQLHKWLKVR